MNARVVATMSRFNMSRFKWWSSMPKQALSSDIAIAMTVKVALIIALVALFARPAFHPANDAAATATAVVGAAGNGAASP